MAMRWRVYSDEFTAIQVPVPQLSEQQSIVAYLDEKCGKFNKIITKLNNEISLLTEYRTCLISDVVTGKLDIRGVVVPEYIPEYDSANDDAGENDEPEEFM
jgi:type I restriction enzyme S subunit